MPESYVRFTTEPPQPDKLELLRVPVYSSDEKDYLEFGHEVGLELIDAFTNKERGAKADSVDILTAALVIVNQDFNALIQPKLFINGVIEAMHERHTWRTRQAKHSPLVH